MTQCEKILKHIEKHGSITPLEAYDYGIMRLASRISELKHQGYNIKREMQQGRNRDGETVYWAKYSMNNEEKNL